VDPETAVPNGGVEANEAGNTVPFDDPELVDRAKAAENGAKFKRLWDGDTSGYPSQSEANHVCSETPPSTKTSLRYYRRDPEVAGTW